MPLSIDACIGVVGNGGRIALHLQTHRVPCISLHSGSLLSACAQNEAISWSQRVSKYRCAQHVRGAHSMAKDIFLWGVFCAMVWVSCWRQLEMTLGSCVPHGKASQQILSSSFLEQIGGLSCLLGVPLKASGARALVAGKGARGVGPIIVDHG